MKKIIVLLIVLIINFLASSHYAITTLRDNELYFDAGFLIQDNLDENLDSLLDTICYDTSDFSTCETEYDNYISNLNLEVGIIHMVEVETM